MTKTTIRPKSILDAGVTVHDYALKSGHLWIKWDAGDGITREIELPALAALRLLESAGEILIGRVCERPGREPYYLRLFAEEITTARHPLSGEDVDTVCERRVLDWLDEIHGDYLPEITRAAQSDPDWRNEITHQPAALAAFQTANP